MSREAMKMALEALERGETKLRWAAISALKAALAEPEQKPVAWELRMGKTDRVLMEITNNPERAQNWRASLCEVVPLYYAPTPQPKPQTTHWEGCEAVHPECKKSEQKSWFTVEELNEFATKLKEKAWKA